MAVEVAATKTGARACLRQRAPAQRCLVPRGRCERLSTPREQESAIPHGGLSGAKARPSTSGISFSTTPKLSARRPSSSFCPSRLAVLRYWAQSASRQGRGRRRVAEQAPGPGQSAIRGQAKSVARPATLRRRRRSRSVFVSSLPSQSATPAAPDEGAQTAPTEKATNEKAKQRIRREMLSPYEMRLV